MSRYLFVLYIQKWREFENSPQIRTAQQWILQFLSAIKFYVLLLLLILKQVALYSLVIQKEFKNAALFHYHKATEFKVSISCRTII